MVLGDVIFFGVLRPSAADIDNQGILNPKDGVGGFVGVISEVKGSFISSASTNHNKNKGKKRKTYVIK